MPDKMTNFRAQDMPGTKLVSYAKGSGPGDPAPEQSQQAPAQNQVQDSNEVPDGTAKEVTDWVGDDAERAQRALDAENAQGEDARSTLIEDLERVIRRNEDNDEDQDEQQA